MSTEPQLLSVNDYAAIPVVEADQRIWYGGDEQQFGDLFLPKGPSPQQGPFPVVLLLHGGCWRDQFGLEPLGQLARTLTQDGYATWNLEYSRLGSGGGWPHTFLDVASGTDHLHEIADDYHLDLTNVIAMGHSAGGHLALWLAGRHRLPLESKLYLPNPLQLKGLVSVAGIPNLAEAAAQNICRGAPQELMGGLPDEVPERYAECSPHALLPLDRPQILINGALDVVVPTPYIKQYEAFAQQYGEAVALIEIPNVGHFEPVIVTTPAWQVVRRAIQGLSTAE
ncbi:alpha/beta hydrolase [Chloroflexi bacterium TSY]|nr:alpha/beta hydrolase [Chloroflexi bacterium TSY]